MNQNVNRDVYEKVASIIESRAEGLLNDAGVDMQVCFSITDKIFELFSLKPGPYPTEPGTYWFYGDPFQIKEDMHSSYFRIYSVQVRTKVNGKPVHIAEGNFFANNFPGWWAKALIPPLQKE